MTHIKLKKNEEQQNTFSLIADFEGDVSELFNKEIEETLPILPLRNMVLFPGVMAPVAVGRPVSLKLEQQAEAKNMLEGVVCQKDASVDNPSRDDLFDVGVVARVAKVLELPGGNVTAILQAFGRFSLGEVVKVRPFMVVKATAIPEALPDEKDSEYNVRCEQCRENTANYVKLNESIRNEAVFALNNIDNPVFLTNFICTNLPISIEEKAEMLAENNLKARAYKLLAAINRETQFVQLKLSIQQKTRGDLDLQQKEYYLQQELRNIQEELGDGQLSDVEELTEQAKNLKAPEEAMKHFNQELRKLESIPQQSPDYSVSLNYLKTFISLPWGKQTEDNLSLENAERILDRDHYGLEKVKERILEHLALLRVSKEMKTPIICLVGPPGVGKTSLGRSIADALCRKYVRVSLGGVNDEAEIRGHRRTYVGAMPGRIIKSIIKAETENPLFILDEIDKVGEASRNGDPQSALLEVLDPEQNSSFHDNFLDFDYDLSKVMFIATANSLSTIQKPLLDRMEIVDVSGYLTEEKKEIARRHLVRRQLKNLDFGEGVKLKLTAPAIEKLIEGYTRETGVRQLDKQLDKVFRKIAYLYGKGEFNPAETPTIKPADIEKLLGKPLFTRDVYQGNKYAGVVTGLAWTAVGGEILFIETSLSRSKTPKLTLTGNLGDVMKESAVLALEYLKAHAEQYNIDYRIFDNWSIRVHVPEGATPKDGPSAGITIATSLASALTQRKVRPHLAMTGEITLRGRVLPVGGIKEKILAAKRAGITDIAICVENRKDIEDINAKYVEGLTFHYVETVSDVLKLALLDEKVDHPIDFTVEEEKNKS